MATAREREFKKEDILSKLAQADERARDHGDALTGTVGDWVERVAFLTTDKCPITYLPILCVLLTARALRGADELDVLAPKTGSSEKGYSAQSIGKRLIPFAGQCGIDLRSKSTQVLNSQPFTYKKFIVPDMAGDQHTAAYAQFYEDATLVQGMTSDEALTVLAYLFHTRRGAGPQPVTVIELEGGKELLDSLVTATAGFVDENSEQGKVGQAFAAALYDLLYGDDQVRMGNNNDPSFTAPGDVQVGPGVDYWLWGEVKQKNIVTAEVQTFMDKVRKAGGERVVYFALANHRYEGQLNDKQLQKVAARVNIDLVIYTSPLEALLDLISKAPGPFHQVASDFATRFTTRMQEAQVTSALEDTWAKVLDDLK